MEVEFTEIDLSKQSFWYNRGEDIRTDVDLSQFAGQIIETVEMAERIGNEILAQEQAQGFLRDRVLWSIHHDPYRNIWIFTYGEYPPIPGETFFASVDGNTSELRRMWVD